MTRTCEITGKRNPHPNNLAAEQKKQKSLHIVRRKIEIPELKRSVRLHVSKEGLTVLKEVGGLVAFIQSKGNKKLSAKLNKIKQQLPKPKKEEKAKEEVAEAKEAAAPVEEAKE